MHIYLIHLFDRFSVGGISSFTNHLYLQMETLGYFPVENAGALRDCTIPPALREKRGSQHRLSHRVIVGEAAGCEVREMEHTDRCCGFGGTFAMKYPQISGSMVREKVDCIQKTGAPICVVRSSNQRVFCRTVSSSRLLNTRNRKSQPWSGGKCGLRRGSRQ